MYKLMIVDDEKYIRKSIRNRIDWEKYGLSVEAEAGNGEEALRLLEEVRPEVVLVDIRMPVMDGLAFISEAKKRLPQTCYIIMSAYSDFAYAKKAIQLGVEEYILKPVDEDEISKVLKNIIHNLNQVHLTKQMTHLESREQDVSLTSDKIAAVAFWDGAGMESAQKIDALIKNAPYIVKQKVDFYMLEDYSRENCYVYLLNGELLTNDGIQSFLDGLQMGEDTIAAFSMVIAGRTPRDAASRCIQALKKKLFVPNQRVLCESRQEEFCEKERKKALRERISVVYRFLVNKEYEKSAQEYMGIIDQVVRSESSVEMIEEFISESLVMLNHFPGEKNDSTDFEILFHKLKSRDYLLDYKNAGELKNDLRNMLNYSANHSDSTNKRDVIGAIKDYIQENYSGDLTATHIANKFYVNTGYLSTLFRDKTGIKLVTYIEGIRMEKAKEFLKNSAWTITEIALETGYSDANYFSKVFKKYTGMSPRQYRELVALTE